LYAISFGDATVEAVTMHKIRNVQKFTVGESVEALIENGEYQACEVTSLPDANGLVNLKIVESGKVVEGFSPIYLSRVGGYTPVKPDRNSPVYGLVVGATVEVLNADEGVWYTGTISNVNTESDAEYTIDFVDETTSVVSDPRTIRPLSDYIPGEILKVYVEAEDDYTEVKYVSKLSYGTFKGEQVSTGYSVEGFQSIHVGRTGRFAE
jgi:hypothetical protein